MLEFCGLVGIGWNVGMLECGGLSEHVGYMLDRWSWVWAGWNGGILWACWNRLECWNVVDCRSMSDICWTGGVGFGLGMKITKKQVHFASGRQA
jgi:hypothetical protein